MTGRVTQWAARPLFGLPISRAQAAGVIALSPALWLLFAILMAVLP